MADIVANVFFLLLSAGSAIAGFWILRNPTKIYDKLYGDLELFDRKGRLARILERSLGVAMIVCGTYGTLLMLVQTIRRIAGGAT